MTTGISKVMPKTKMTMRKNPMYELMSGKYTALLLRKLVRKLSPSGITK